MTVLLIEPGKTPRHMEIDGTLEGMQQVVSGTAFLCAAPLDSDNVQGLTEEALDLYKERFLYLELFISVEGKLVCIPVCDET